MRFNLAAVQVGWCLGVTNETCACRLLLLAGRLNTRPRCAASGTSQTRARRTPSAQSPRRSPPCALRPPCRPCIASALDRQQTPVRACLSVCLCFVVRACLFVQQTASFCTNSFPLRAVTTATTSGARAVVRQPPQQHNPSCEACLFLAGCFSSTNTARCDEADAC